MRVGIEAIDFTSFGGGQKVIAEFIKILQKLKQEVIIFSNLKFSERDRKKIREMWKIGKFNDIYIPNLKNVSFNSLIFNLYLKFHKIDSYISAGWLLLSKKKREKDSKLSICLCTPLAFPFQEIQEAGC